MSEERRSDTEYLATLIRAEVTMAVMVISLAATAILLALDHLIWLAFLALAYLSGSISYAIRYRGYNRILWTKLKGDPDYQALSEREEKPEVTNS